jgi:hypothetical protein
MTRGWYAFAEDDAATVVAEQVVFSIAHELRGGARDSTVRHAYAGDDLRRRTISLVGNRLVLDERCPDITFIREANLLDRVRFGKECRRRSHGSFSRAIYRTGLSLLRNRALLWTTNTILRIRTAARRFLTKARRSFRAAEDGGFVVG